MSNFIFGNLFLHKDLKSIEDIEKDIWDIIGFSIKKRIHLLLGCNISQKIIYEMLGNFQINDLNNKIPFLITDNPLFDVIEKLIIAGEISSDSTINNNLSNMVEVMLFCLNKEKVKSINLFFSSGYDDNFKEIELKINSLKEKIVSILSQNYNFPSVKFIITV